MTQYEVAGMSCAACSARVEKGGVGTAGRGQLLGESADKFNDGRRFGLTRRYHQGRAGCGLQRVRQGVQKSSAAEEDALADHDTPVLKRRLFARRLPARLMYSLDGAHDVGLAAAKVL